MTRKIPFFNYPHVFTSSKQELVDIFNDVGSRGAFILQKDCKEFEEKLAQFLEAKYVLGVANCTDAMIIALRAAGLNPGDEVIFSSHTFVATAAAIHFAGGVPVPIECGRDHLMDPSCIEKAITPRTRAIMPTQLNGRTCKMDQIQEIASKHGLFIIEDAAQGLGSRYKGKAAGTFGLAGTISFYPAKVLGCFGDGGAIVTNDDTMYEKMYALHDHGRGTNGEVVMWGLNSRLDNLQAAILLHGLRSYPQVMKRRRELALLYNHELESIPELLLPPPPQSEEAHFDIFQNYEIEADRRDELVIWLKHHEIGTLLQWGGKAVHEFPNLGLNKYSLPFTEKVMRRSLLLPFNTSLSNEDVLYVTSTIRNFYRHA